MNPVNKNDAKALAVLRHDMGMESWYQTQNWRQRKEYNAMIRKSHPYQSLILSYAFSDLGNAVAVEGKKLVVVLSDLGKKVLKHFDK